MGLRCLGPVRPNAGKNLARVPKATLVRLPRSEVFWQLAQRAPLLRIRDSRQDRGYYRSGNIVLHGKDIGQIAVVTLRPDMVAGIGVDEFCRDADPLAAPTHAAFQHVANTKLASDLLHVDCTRCVW